MVWEQRDSHQHSGLCPLLITFRDKRWYASRFWGERLTLCSPGADRQRATELSLILSPRVL